MKIEGLSGELHPGITMHKIPVQAGFPGLVFTIGMLAVFLMGIPALIYFLVFSTVLGIGFAALLRFIPRQAGVIAFVFSTRCLWFWLVFRPWITGAESARGILRIFLLKRRSQFHHRLQKMNLSYRPADAIAVSVKPGPHNPA